MASFGMRTITSALPNGILNDLTVDPRPEQSIEDLTERFKIGLKDLLSVDYQDDNVQVHVGSIMPKRCIIICVTGVKREVRHGYENMCKILEYRLNEISQGSHKALSILLDLADLSGQIHNKSEAFLRDFILNRYGHKISLLMSRFSNAHQAKLDQIADLWLGVTGITLSNAEASIAEQLFKIQKISKNATDEGSQRLYSRVVDAAIDITSDPVFDCHLITLLGKVDASYIVPLLQSLAEPAMIHKSLALFVKSVGPFAKVQIRLIEPHALHELDHNSLSTIADATRPQHVMNNTFRKPSARTRSKRKDVEIQIVNLDELQEMFDIIRPYLATSDQQQGFARLIPRAKQHCAHFLANILKRGYIPPEIEAYYNLGFVTCNTDTEHQTLAWILKDLFMTEGQSRGREQALFEEFYQAVECSTLVTLLDKYGYDGFREKLIRLESFLQIPQAARPCVFRLIRFIRSEDTDPTEEICVEYGFRNCKHREDVTILKGIYQQILGKATPGEVQRASIQGKLFEFGCERGVIIPSKYERLMKNR